MRSSCVREIVLLRENHNVCNSSTDCNKSQQAKKGESYKKKYSTASSKLKNLKITVKKKLENYSEKKGYSQIYQCM